MNPILIFQIKKCILIPQILLKKYDFSHQISCLRKKNISVSMFKD